MDYSYNYGYLQEYMESHRLAKKDLLEAFGSNDYVSLNKWLDGRVPVHTTALLRFCNYYNVPLGNFFVDADGLPADIRPRKSEERDQLLPTDGYGIKEGRGRGIVETRISERIVSSTAQSAAIALGLKRQIEQRNERDVAVAEQAQRQDITIEQREQPRDERSVEQTSQTLTETILRMKLDHSKDIRELEHTHQDKEDNIRLKYDNERDRLLAIIEQQTKEIARLSTTQVKAYGNMQGDNSFIGVAEQK